MGTLTLELSDEQLQKPEHLAQKRGTSIQALMIAMFGFSYPARELLLKTEGLILEG
jgi:hypothetical protein